MISSRRSRAYTAVAAGAALIGLSACGGGSSNSADGGGDADPIEVVSQPDYEGKPIDLDLPTHSSGAFEFDKWPSACALTDEESVKAVLPGVVEIGQKPTPTKMTIISIGSGGGNEENTIPEGMCLTSTGFDLDGLRLDDGNVVVNLTTRILQAGDADYIKKNGELPQGEEKFDLGEAKCVQAPQNITCGLENIVFEMNIDARLYEQYGHPEGSLYSVNGEEIDYSSDTEGFMTMSEEKILKPIAEIAVGRLSS
ncbi:hypothetical protein [Brevibacterium spongiae]|uniref:Lipoprotein n=1 Tax=Brevibacterium spongiae TaxID=2909672 RepID=A0ABY5SVI3_9MICO|nr:hypothetical protein [Brevibacterium spongiae]UVI37041.1 hypothetical protein L1F31_05140 [Brevibacterium spongiae]